MDNQSLITLLDAIPTCEQSQDSLQRQLFELQFIARKLGLYDAADYINHRHERMSIQNPSLYQDAE